MSKIYITLIFILSVSTAFSQAGIDSVLAEIEKNNTTLAAYRKNADADKIGNKTSLLPENPEVGFNYLWGNPDQIGNRTDLSVTQSFDFPTAYMYKSQLANLKNEQVEMEYKRQRYDVLLGAKVLCTELTYLNALYAEYQKRFNNDLKNANAFKKKMEVGDATILEYNKSQISLLNTEKQLEQIKIERDVALLQLAWLNGGNTLDYSDSVFVADIIEPDFEKWYAQAASYNPMLNWLKQEIAISLKEKQLRVAQNLPKINTGYMSEKVVGEQFHGVTLGLSIPLWGNKNTVKYARLKTEAVNSMETDAKVQFYNEMKTLHGKATALQNSITDFKQRISANNILDLLEKGMQKGEISISEYYYELMFFYANKEELLSMEKELNITLAKLNKYSL
ncbi:TolC family protein [Saccharicrinis sp. GN24d3]|uniref:TolC family protein n=1 Tax=Saccharicrinis sp. GN24d3 TaxID=3458416 RepID=UPI004036863D